MNYKTILASVINCLDNHSQPCTCIDRARRSIQPIKHRWALTIKYPYPKVSINSFGGRYGRFQITKAKEDWSWILADLKQKQKIPDATKHRFVSVKITWVRGRPPDSDNADKVLRDAMKRAKLIQDDGPSFATFQETVVEHGKERTITIEIAEQ